jgi:ubiquitin carboxyl-terminal hydrolase L5
MSNSAGWCTIESDPGVFTELVEQLGVTGLEFQEIFDLDESSIRALGDNVYGIVFLFKHTGSAHTKEVMPVVPDDLFFARQLVENACATQAILSVLLNMDPSPSVNLGSTLSDFKSFTDGMDPETRGLAIGDSDSIRTVHNSFRPRVSLEISHDNDKSGEAFHFVSLLWHKGSVFELDGLQAAPIHIGSCPSRSDWLSVAVPHIQSRIAEYTSSGSSEIRFNLLAIVEDSRSKLRELIGETSDRSGELNERLVELESKRMKWKNENARRRHDFMPLALACLETLAQKGELVGLYQKHKQQ